MTTTLPIISSVVMVVFVAATFRTWFARRRPAPFLWGIGLAMFAVGSLAEVYSAFGWDPLVFRSWYLFGAMLNAAWIGQGTVFLLARPRFAAISMVVLAMLSAVGAYGIATVAIDGASFTTSESLGQQYQEILPEGAWVRGMTPVFNIYGLVSLVGGAVYSAWLFWRKRAYAARMWGNMMIAAGALSIGVASSLARLGSGEFLYLGEVIAAALMFGGFLLASRRVGAPSIRRGRGVVAATLAGPASRTLFMAFSVMVLLLVLSACSSEDAEVPEDETQATGSVYPVEIGDMLDRTIVIPERPERIVTLSPTATEMLYLVGDAAVGRDSTSGYPAEVEALPEVGGAYSPSVEAVAALDPDLILIEALTQGHLVSALETLDVPVVAVRATSVDDVVDCLYIVAEIVDRGAEGGVAAKDLVTRIEAASRSDSDALKFLILISDADRSIYAAKPESYPGAVADQHGLENLAAGLPDSGPFPGFTLMSAEQVIAGEPDVIFTISPAPAPAPKLSDMLPRVPGYSTVAAVQQGRVKELSPQLFLSTPGPRIVDAVEEMALLIEQSYP